MSVLLREAIGDSIRRARTERRRTLREVSRDARVSLGYLSEVERGRKEPSSELLAAICDALSVTLPDLLDEAADTLRPAGARRGVDPRLRSAVEEAFGPAADAPAATDTAATGAGDAATARASTPAAPASASASYASDPTRPPDALAGDEAAGVDGVLDGLAVGDRAGAGEQAVPGTVTLIARLPAPGGSVRVAA